MPRIFTAFSLLAFFLYANSTSAQADIAEARSYDLGAAVSISGVVNCGAEMDELRFMQDGTAGIGLKLDEAATGGWAGVFGAAPVEGDAVSCTGVLAEVQSALVVLVTTGSVDGSGESLAPLAIGANEIGEDLEGQLVQVSGVNFQNGGETFNDFDPFSFLDAAWSVGKARVAPLSNLVGMVIPSSTVTLTGVVSQISITGSGGYHVIARTLPDVQSSTGLTLGGIRQTNLTDSTVTLHWATDQPASSNVEYGLTTALGMSVEGAGDVYFHEATIEGLTPGSMVYARVISATDAFSAESDIHVYATVSESSGTIRVYFNSDVDESYAGEQIAVNVDNAIVDTLAAYLGLAQSTLDIAVYNTNNDELVDAANAAHDAGVRVRWITEGENANYALDDLNPAIPVLERGDGGGSGMHNKFVIIDADDAQNAWVLTGSGNWTTGNLISDCNNFIFFQDQSLARGYRLEFEEMWGGDGDMYDAGASVFGADKTDNTPKQFLIGGRPVELYFSPSDGTNEAIRRTLLSADQRIEFQVFSFTRDDLGDAIIDRHNAGCETIGIIDDWFGAGTEYYTLNAAGVPTYEHQGIPGTLHHKLVIVDGDYPDADPTVLTGSHNWSSNAESVNDENTVVVHDALIANLYRQEIWGRFDDINIGVGKLPGNGLGSAFPALELIVWPNPTIGPLALSCEDGPLRLSLYEVFDTSGRRVARGQSSSEGIINLSRLPDGAYTVISSGRSARVILSQD